MANSTNNNAAIPIMSCRTTATTGGGINDDKAALIDAIVDEWECNVSNAEETSQFSSSTTVLQETTVTGISEHMEESVFDNDINNNDEEDEKNIIDKYIGSGSINDNNI